MKKCSNFYDKDGYKFSNNVFMLYKNSLVECYSCHDLEKILFDNATLIDGYFPTINEQSDMKKFYEIHCLNKEYDREKLDIFI